MRVILGQVHRSKILSFLPPGGHLLEWGAGGSTVWFADHLPPGAMLTSIEHNPTWYTLVAAEVGTPASVRLLLREAERPFGRKDTRDEEDPAAFMSYIHAVAGERFDVIFVDGMARAACLVAARELLKPGGVVFLHDSQRPWYDEAKQVYRSWGTIGSCPDYPSPNLWFGGVTPAAPAPVAPVEPRVPLIVSYYTIDTPYEKEVQGLIASCDRLGLEHDVVGLPAAESWDANCARKAEVCLNAWRRHGRPILWVDADAELMSPPSLLETCTADFAIHRWDDSELTTGTVFFNQTPLAERLLERWVERCRAEPQVGDQAQLDMAWEETTAAHPLETCWLPRSYYQIFDAAVDPKQPTVVQQNQASRRFKTVVTKSPPRPFPTPSEAVHRARRASRPRRWFQLRPDSPDFHIEAEQDRRLDALLHNPRQDRTAATPAGSRPEGWWCATSEVGESHLDAERTLIEACLQEVEAEVRDAREAMLDERMAELASRLRSRQPTSFAIYGSAAVGQALLRVTRRLGLAPVCFVESDPVRRRGAGELGLPVWSVEESLAAGCHLYAIGSFASAGAMMAILDRAYASTGFRYEALVPLGPPPPLPDIDRAARTLLASQACLAGGRALADALFLI